MAALKVEGKTVVLTGEFEAVTRSVAKSALVSKGARVTGSVSSKTELLFFGRNPGSNLAKAKSLGIRVYKEHMLMAVLRERTKTEPCATDTAVDPELRARIAAVEGPGYAFDVYCDRIYEWSLDLLKSRAAEIAGPVVWIKFQQGCQDFLAVSHLELRTESDRLMWPIDFWDHTIPESIYSTGSLCERDQLDEVLAGGPRHNRLLRVLVKHGVDVRRDDGSMPGWGEIRTVPHSLLIHELLITGRRVHDELKRSGLVAKGCVICCGAEDDTWGHSLIPDARNIGSRDLAFFKTEEALTDFAKLCYDKPEKRRWLIELGMGTAKSKKRASRRRPAKKK